MLRHSSKKHLLTIGLNALRWQSPDKTLQILLVQIAGKQLLPDLQDLSIQLQGQAISVYISEALPSPSLPASILFMQQAPPVAEVTDAIAALTVLAEAHQIPIREVGYQDVIHPDSDLLAYQINFSVEADYPGLRVFIAAILVELPYLALQQLTIQRDEISSQQLRGDLQFTRYMRRGS